jgi:hypothetical protein
MVNIDNCAYNFDGMEVNSLFSENQTLVADYEAMEFNFHYVRKYSDEINDSVIKINLLKNGIHSEYLVNNIQLNVTITGLRIFDSDNNNKLIRFVLAGKCSSLYIYNGFAIID